MKSLKRPYNSDTVLDSKDVSIVDNNRSVVLPQTDCASSLLPSARGATLSPGGRSNSHQPVSGECGHLAQPDTTTV